MITGGLSSSSRGRLRELRTLDRVILGLFVVLWLLCFSLGTRAALRHTGYRSIIVSGPSRVDGYPELVGFISAAGEVPTDSALRRGDRLIRLGDTDLRGMGPIDVAMRFARERGPNARLPVRFVRSGEQEETTVAVGSYRMFWPRLPAALVFALAAVFLLLRAPGSAMVRAFVYNYMCVALLLECMFAGGTFVTYLSIAVHVLSLTLAAPLAVRGALLFPHGVEPDGRAARIGPMSSSRAPVRRRSSRARTRLAIRAWRGQAPRAACRAPSARSAAWSRSPTTCGRSPGSSEPSQSM